MVREEEVIMPVVLEDVKAAAATLTVREQFDLIQSPA